MLVLSRRIGERLVIGTDTVVQVLSVRGNQIRLGINAPPSVKVLREEVFLATQGQWHDPNELLRSAGESGAGEGAVA